ncbi:MAG: exodeoxyribonuclease VII large subunit [Desulfamplus sp.]|nr:exodeoxyribonuclease VII large subunit [Desulfamplus sp.]
MAKLEFGHIYTVSSLTREIKTLLEEQYPFVWVTGEISNIALPSSGHAYFSLKDDDSLISCVMFRNQNRRLDFIPGSGMKITGMGRLSLYEPRGTYQLILEHMTQDGSGSLHIKFEQLKNKLKTQGLFDAKHKKNLPFLPSKIAIITSPTGAVIRDIIHVANRRFPNIHLQIMPVKVQGEGSEHEIVRGIEILNSLSEPGYQDHSPDVNASPDVIIIARGGGSMEDLAPFNSETVARAVFESKIPVVSAIGHETDFTICDFVADIRAPTPSAAAEIVLPEKRVLDYTTEVMENRLCNSMIKQLDNTHVRLREFESRLKNPLILIQDMHLRIDDLVHRMSNRIQLHVNINKESMGWLTKALYKASPGNNLHRIRNNIGQLRQRLETAILSILKGLKYDLKASHSALTSLNPMAVLDRGYSITRRHGGKDYDIIRDVSEISIGENVEVILSKGSLICRIEEKNDNPAYER